MQHVSLKYENLIGTNKSLDTLCAKCNLQYGLASVIYLHSIHIMNKIVAFAYKKHDEIQKVSV